MADNTEGIIPNFDFDVDGIEGANEEVFEVELKQDAPLSASDEALSPLPVVETQAENTSADTSPGTEDDTNEGFDVTLKTGAPTTTEEGKGASENTPSPDSAPSSPSLLVTDFASALYRDGILTGIDSEDALKDLSVKGLADAIKDTIKQNEFDGLGEEGKRVLEAIRNGVPVEAIAENHNMKLTLDTYTEDAFIENDADDTAASENKAEIRKSLIYNDFVARGYEPKDALRKTDASFAAADDEEDAKISIKNLRAMQAKVEAEQYEGAKTQREDASKRLEKTKDDILKTENIFPGIPVSEKVRQNVADSVTVPTGRKENGKLRSLVTDTRDADPNAFDMRLNYLIHMGVFNEKPDLSIFTSRGMTSAIEELEKNITTEGLYDGGQGVSLDSIGSTKARDNVIALVDRAQI